MSGVEAFLNDDGSSRARKTSLTSPAGYHRSRERTRQSAVQRLVERKLAQKEKEREKERDRSWGSIASNNASNRNGGFSVKSFPSKSPSRSDLYQRDRSGTRSENGFMLGAGRSSSPSKENIEPDFFELKPRRTARSVSGTRYRDINGSEEPTAKTYITIGPGKPTRIREHSPSKSAKLSTDETVTSARERSAQSRNSSPLKVFDLNRSISPSPQRKTREHPGPKEQARSASPDKKKELLRNSSPLKSTNILKTFRTSKGDIFDELQSDSKKTNSQPFTTEKTFFVNHTKSNYNNNNCNAKKTNERRLSIEILNSVYRQAESDKQQRASPESEGSGSSSVSSFSSPLSGSSDSVESNDKGSNIHLSQRRISLEQRFQARARINSPERPTVTRKVSEVKTSYSSTRSTKINTSTEFVLHSRSTSRTNSEFRKYSRDSSGSNLNNLSNLNKPIPASRKISLPQTAGKRPEPAPRRRSLNTILSPERWAVNSICLTRIMVMGITMYLTLVAGSMHIILMIILRIWEFSMNLSDQRTAGQLVSLQSKECLPLTSILTNIVIMSILQTLRMQTRITKTTVKVKRPIVSICHQYFINQRTMDCQTLGMNIHYIVHDQLV